MGTWEPKQEGLVQLAALLGDFQKPGSNQTQILQQLESFKVVPDFNNYLAFILARGDQLSVEVRQGAGLLLKNNLKQQYEGLAEDYKAFIKELLLPMLAHSSRPLRQTAGSIVSVVVEVSRNLSLWPQLIATISALLQSPDEASCDGGICSLYKIIEDQPTQLECRVQVDASGGHQTASGVVVPLLLRLMPSPSADIRSKAVASLNLLTREMPVALMDQLDTYLQGLFALAHDSSMGVRREVCIGLVQLVSIQPDRLAPFLYQVIEYMLASNEHSDHEVAVQSCEFWQSFCDAQLDPELLRPFLPRLIPVLMKNMVWEEYDEEVQEAEEAEVSGPKAEKDSELKPFMAKDRQHADPAAEDCEDGGGGDDDDDDESVGVWNLRRGSAAALDRLSLAYGDDLLPILLPIVEQRLQDANWRARESAILALGAVAEGCEQGLLPFLSGMISMMLPKLADPRPMVRIISCWSLTRYSHWMLQGAAAEAGSSRSLSVVAPGTLPGAIQGVLRCVVDHNKFVQNAAITSIANLMESSMNDDKTQLLHPFLRPILEALGSAIPRLSRRNLRVLFDVLETTMEAMGGAVTTPEMTALYLCPLFQRFQAYELQDKDLVPLIDCLASLLPRLRDSSPLVFTCAPAMFDKAMKLAASQLELRLAGQQEASGGAEFDADALTCSLDLVSGLSEALGGSMEALVSGSALAPLIARCCVDDKPAVRQSAFALVGDLARACPGVLHPILPVIVTTALQILDPALMTQETLKSCNNACWALGELAIKLQPENLIQGNLAERIAERTAGILLHGGRLTRSIIENSAITLGRVAWMCPEQCAPHFAHFCAAWCSALRGIRDDTEKEHSFMGLCSVIRLNPEPAMAAFGSVAAAIVSWRQIQCEGLGNSITQVVQGLKQGLVSSGRWDQALASMGEVVSRKLSAMCAV